ncbi:MAG: hypothetical protein ACI802_003158, partial [Candidatus Paceibacteria bacterium]
SACFLRRKKTPDSGLFFLGNCVILIGILAERVGFEPTVRETRKLDLES